MKFKFIFVPSSKDKWFEEALSVYTKKISGFAPFEVQALKSKSMGRESADEKRTLESQVILKNLSPKDFVILFDEAGEGFKDSHSFSASLKKAQESGKQSICLVIGGAFGSSDELKNRANKTWSLSRLTMNHMLASIVALEQTYRALTIQKNIPYHN